MHYTIPIEGQWRQFSDADLKKMRERGQGDMADLLLDRVMQYERNRFSFFLPHGRPWQEKEKVLDLGDAELVIPASNYPKEWGNDCVAFMNDDKADVCLLLAPNQCGKSFAGAAWTIRRVIPCNENWEIFTRHKIVPYEWNGPVVWIVASYSWDNVATLWKRYRALLPRYELLNYAPNWGKYDGERGRPKDLAFGSGRTSAATLQLACGSVLKFACYTQQQMHWESYDSNGAHFDEQAEEEQWVGWDRSTSTHGDYTPCCMTLTGHVMEDRANTGAAGWIKSCFWDGNDTKGQLVHRYALDIESTPDFEGVGITPKKKAKKYRQFADPSVKRSEKQQRAAIARYWGGWEEGSGLWIDIWNRRYHVVPPLWDDDKAPRDWTKWRVIDYGDNGITCCLWFALGPKGYAFVYRELYERGLTIAEACRLITQMSYGEREQVGSHDDPLTGNVYQIFQERLTHERYYATLLDSRSCSQRQQGETLESIFCRYGIEVAPACGQKNVIQIPRLKEWLRINFREPHLSLRNEKGDRVAGNTRLMVFDGRAVHLVDEMESLQRDKKDPNKLAANQADHAVDACVVGHTLVTMDNGERKAIESIEVGDMVMTRGGPNPVIATGSRTAELYALVLGDGRILEGTCDHPIFSPELGDFIPLDNFKQSMLVCCEPLTRSAAWMQKLSNGEALSSEGIQTAKTGQIEITTAPMASISRGVLRLCMSRFTKLIVDLCLKDGVCTTRTGILSTMKYRILSALAQKHILTFISETSENTQKNTSIACGLDTGSGAKRMPLAGITIKLRKEPRLLSGKSGNTTSRLKSYVRSVVKPLLTARFKKWLSSVAKSAIKPLNVLGRKIMIQRYAQYACRNTCATSTAIPKLVPVRAVIRLGRQSVVYNIEVANLPEYFANGILTHNCKYWASDNPSYMGDDWFAEKSEGDVERMVREKRKRTKFTGY